MEGEKGKRYQPDVVVYLPQNKHVVIDSKMALVAYERYFNAETDAERVTVLSDHLLLVHLILNVKWLSKKDYHQLKEVESLDFVLMFIPIEPVFQIAIQAAPQLIKEAM